MPGVLPRSSSFLLLGAALCNVVIAGPAQKPLNGQQTAPRQLQGRFLHITDLHPDAFYKVHSSTEEGVACHHGKGPAGTYGAETSDCDSPFALINATFAWVEEHVKDKVDFVIWTGDSARHDSDLDIPRNQEQVLGTNRMVAQKFTEAFADESGQRLSVPIVPTFGNNDILPHNILLPGPNRWLQTYSEIWRPFIPEEQRHSFEFGGWFYTEVIPGKLAVFSLNTLYFFDRNAGVDDCLHPSQPGFKQMEWLRIQLQFLRERGMKAILIGHVPPARTESKQLWDETCWQKYTLWLRQYRDVVTGSVYGHMNIDHFLLQDTREIDMGMLGGTAEQKANVRRAMEDELSIESAADYLQELRSRWSKLPDPVIKRDEQEDGVDEEGKKRGKGGKKGGRKKREKALGGPYAERYQLSLVSPSIVPNYFPTIRIVEYNISGLEDHPVWVDQSLSQSATPRIEPDDQLLELRGVDEVDASKKKHKKKGKKGKHDKDKKPKDPNLVVPDPPAKTSPPGPAYSPQSLTFLGYTQYYANLTRINNDIAAKELALDEQDADDVTADKWRGGKHHGKSPKSKKPKPRKFKFQVEYSTFDDRLYNLTDLTVHSFVQLAYKMGQAKASNHLLHGDQVDLERLDDLAGPSSRKDQVEAGSDAADADFQEDAASLGAVGNERQKSKKHKKKKKKKHHKKADKIWRHFLRHAFVSSLEEDDLDKLV